MIASGQATWDPVGVAADGRGSFGGLFRFRSRDSGWRNPLGLTAHYARDVEKL
jgi:hypothetical protein